jgi:hypothetical protein
MKEAFDYIWLFLQTAEMRDRLHLHALLGQVLVFCKRPTEPLYSRRA